jgi:arylsulfatase A-like enzyme
MSPTVRAPARRGALIAAMLVVALAGCRDGTPPAQRLALQRPGAGTTTWSQCGLQRQGETRPATGCARAHLLAHAANIAVPASGRLDVSLDSTAMPAGRLQVKANAFTYAGQPEDSISRMGLEHFDSFFGPRSSDGQLEASFANRDPAFRPAPQANGIYADAVPATVTLEFAPGDVGRSAMYEVWAWPPTAHPTLRVDLDPVTPRPGEGLALSFGIQEPGWRPGSSPVTFSVVGGPTGSPPEVLWSRRIDPTHRVAERGWLEGEADVARFAGTPLALALVAEAESPVGGFPVWGQPHLVAPAQSPDERPNVLLISLDTLRADRLSTLGYDHETSPRLTDFAAGGVTFLHAMSHFPSTTASHMSMLTSLQPCAHGVLVPPLQGPVGAGLSRAATTLAEALGAAGYTTIAITEDGLIQGDIGFDRGFDSYLDQVGRGDEPLGMFAEGIERAERWLERRSDRPFFMFLHTYQPHGPFKVPPFHRDLVPVPADASEVQRLSAEYDAGIRYTDDLLDAFLGQLARRGILDRTLVVITSDHGYEFGEHGGIGHARGVYEEQVHVPLIMRHPRFAHGGRRIQDVIALIDVAPTILSIVGAPRPPTFTGVDLRPLLEGRTMPAREVFSEQLWGPRETLLRTDTRAWIQKTSGLQLYDITTDPTEQHDLAGERAAEAADGGRRIAAFREACAAQAESFKASATAGALDPGRTDALRALGYIE